VVEPAGAQVLHLRRDHLAAGLHPALGPADRRAFGLFFITVYAGRVWCGYTCPQSVWTWIFMWCEKVTEGDRNQRIKLDKAPMSGNKFLRKFASTACGC
jgi:hypothetical protein